MIAMHLVLLKILLEIICGYLQARCNFHMTNDTAPLSYDIVQPRALWWFFGAPDIPSLLPTEYHIAPWIFKVDSFRTTQEIAICYSAH